MKKYCKWYAFGKTPLGVAAAVTALCGEAHVVNESDFSRMDGRVSAVFREFESRMLMRAFDRRDHARCLEAHRTQFNLPGRTSRGVKYDLKFARASGSLETSSFNTAASALTFYVAFRLDGRSPDQAYASLGLYGGDDGLTADINPDKCVHAAQMVGQELTIALVKKGARGVKFLARQYGPNVWHGEPNSCADIVRQVSKFHVTVSLPPDVTPQVKAVEKARGYILSDAETPILGAVCAKILELADPRISIECDAKAQVLHGVRYWHSLVDKKEQYPNEDSGWMTDYACDSLPGFDFERFRKHLDECKSLDDLLQFPLCLDIADPIKPKVAMAVDDRVHFTDPPELKEVEPHSPKYPPSPTVRPSSPVNRAKPERKRALKDKAKSKERGKRWVKRPAGKPAPKASAKGAR